jgi:hypothetical protein
LCSEKQEGRFLLLQCHTPPQNLYSILFAAVYRRPTEGGLGDFSFLPLAFGFYFGFGGFFGPWLLLWAFWCGKLLEGKRIAEGKSMDKEGLIESLDGEL